MKRVQFFSTGLLAVIILLGLIASSAAYIVRENEQVVIVQFGKVVGDAVSEPGLHFKMPFVQNAVRFEKRWLEWDGDASQITTSDKRYIYIDVFARWRIVDPIVFIEVLRDERSAQGRLDDIIDNATRNVVANHKLIEAIRSTNRDFAAEDEGVQVFNESDTNTDLDDETNSQGYNVEYGRDTLTKLIREKASKKVVSMGVEIKDVQIKRISYIESVQKKVYDRMISERTRVAEAFRSKGRGIFAEITGKKEKELRKIRSEAYRTSQEIIGKADALAAKIYADAYNKDPKLYKFLKTMESYTKTVDEKSWLLITTDSEFAAHLKHSKVK